MYVVLWLIATATDWRDVPYNPLRFPVVSTLNIEVAENGPVFRSDGVGGLQGYVRATEPHIKKEV